MPNMRWLLGAQCPLGEPIGMIEARLRGMIGSKDAADPAAFYSRWGVGKEAVEALLATLSELGASR